jgi:tRNA threonylcarbamoyladenosine biosynthesis protein TsaB
MNALAVETATDLLSVAGGQAGRAAEGRVVRRTVEGARRHASQLLPALDEVLLELGLTLREVELIALADGPGSFTGLRVGAAAVKGLVRAHPHLRVATASTLLVRAASVHPPRGARVLVVTSALRGELYAAGYRMDLPHGVETLLPPTLATPESLHGMPPDLLVADLPDKQVERLADQFAVPVIHGDASRPEAAALLALAEVPGGLEPVSDIAVWEPRYGRLAEAQVRWEQAHGKPLPDPAGGER